MKLINLMFIFTSVFLNSCTSQDLTLEQKLISQDFYLAHNFWPSGHSNYLKFKFLGNGAIESDSIPGLKSNEWKTVTNSSFQIGSHMFTWNKKEKCYYSPFDKNEPPESTNHFGYHIIKIDKH
jgi:hypothetical protein